MIEFERVAGCDEVSPGGRLSVIVDDMPALLIRVGDDYYCIEDTCTHDGQAMTDGPIANGEITCPRHGARFDITTGKAVCMPAIEPIAVFVVDVRDDGIYAKPQD